ncbi:MucBP domain-containing protein [Streptococcus iners]|uniref:MucBP domain-containing protein n=1 Tax=Streptococcus iners TaxID=3028084 RepID=UPI0020051D9F|nr:YSIRK-type signal peptide-containing protein [Streptococcus suis]
MQRAKKKSFDWYGMKQHFSIRKYHFGAASVLLGMSLAMGAGAQAAKAETTAATSEPTTATTTSASSTEASVAVTPSSTTETTATVASTTTETSATEVAPVTTTEVVATVERSATINYIVNYVLEDGTLVNAVVKSATVTTTDTTAKTTVEVVAELPEGYELATGQASTVSQEVTEAGENLVTVKLVKKAATTKATTTPTSPTATATKTATETATPVATTPVTVAEAKVVLEQNISEAEVLSNEASRLYTASPEGNESLKTAADATKLAATEAVTVLKDSVATLENVNEQINAVRTNVEALALELRKFLGTEDIQVLLAATSTNLQNVGDGDGILIETGTTATPDMSDPNGASVTSKVSGSLKATEVADYLTIQYTPVAYFDAVAPVYTPFKENGGQSTGGAYFRTSVNPTDLYGKLLVELVANDGTVVETKKVEPNTAVEFDYFKTTHGAGYPFVYTYDPDYDSKDMFGVIRIQWAYNTMSAVSQKLIRPTTNTTVYKTEDGQQLATYTVLTTPDLNTTPSEKREFAGYTYKETTTTTSNVVLVPSEPYVEVTRFATSGVQFKTIVEAVGTDGTIKKTYYIADPNYTGTQSYTDTNLDGFLPILVTDDMPVGTVNTNLKLLPSLLTSGYEVYRVDASTEKIYKDKEGDKQPTPVRGTLITDPAELDFSTLTSTSQWFHIKFNEKQDGTLAFIRVRPAALGNASRMTFEYDTRDTAGATTDTSNWEEGQDFGVRPRSWNGMHHTISLNNNAQTVTETTHIYTPVPQEAIIRYQVEGATDFLEDSGTLTGNPGTDITYSTEDTINKYKKLGYELVSDNFTTDAGQDYDYDSDKLQEFLVVIKPRVVDVPKTVVPGEPVDPTDPNSPVWPATLENLEATQEVTRTVEYKYEDGSPVLVDTAGNVLPKGSTEGTPFVKTETVTFTRPAQVNLVTGDIIYGEWGADTTDTLKGNVLPQVPGYTASRTTLEGADAPMTETINAKTVTATDADINEVVYFAENPKYGDVVVNYVNTDGKVIATPVVDTNDALVGTDYSTADQVPEKIIEDATGDVYYYKEIQAGSNETGTVVEGTTEVTYVYEKAGDVVIKYVDVNGLELQAPVADTTDGKPGSDYNTAEGTEKPATITSDGKVYALVPAGDYPVGTVAADSNLASGATPTGTVEAGVAKEVTYVYQEVKSDVVVEYYDTEGNPISGTETGNATSVVDTEDASVGTAYNTDDKKPATITAADGTVYYYKEVKDTSAPTTGKVAETTTTVQYVYEKAGSVNVNYVDVNGTEIKADVLDVENGQPGSNYDTLADNRPDTIVAKDGKTYKLVPAGDYPVGTVAADSNLASGDAPTGAVEAGVTKEVTYVYKEVKGNVIVNYVDENGKPIAGITDAGTETASTVEDTPESSTGTEYNTTDLRPNTITTADGKIYKLVPSAIPANETGKVVEGTTEVTYVYELVKGDVVVHYVDTEGNTIAKDVTDTKVSDTGTAYDTTDNKPAKITAEDGTVYYILPQDEVQAGSAPETGKVVEGTTEVTYVYQKAGNVVVNYTLADGTVIKAPVNDETNQEPGYDYNTTDNKPETITTADGKVYKLVPAATIGNETGDVEAGKTIEVTYIYEEVKSDVVVEYYNTAGEVIAATVVDEDDKSVGTVYNTDEDNRPETITTADGTVYYYKEVKDTSAPTTGKVAETTTTVQYVYEQAGNVVVNYIAEDGTVIKQPVNDETNAKPGTEYSTTDNKPTTITTEDGKTYELIPTATIGTEEGTVESGKTTEVTYVYKEVKGSVVVNYVTTDGTVLQAPVTDTPETSTGTDYDTTDNKPTTITTADGKTYKLVPALTQGSETGEVVPGVTEVTYVYEEVKGDVVVNYVNTAGEVIAPQVVDTKTTSTGTDYDTTDNKPAKITAEDGTVYYYKEVDATSATETGKVVEGTTAITYVYEQAGNVVVNYITEDGTVIKQPVNDETNAAPGTEYNTTDNKPTTITTEDGTTYELVPSATIGTENGEVESGKTTEVTYVYRKVETPAAKTGNVVVEYYNTAGEKIASDVVDTPETTTGTVYETFDFKPATITKDGVTYFYKEVKADSAAETGDVVEGTTTVKYVYEPAGSVTVNYVTTDGTVIKSPVKDEENAEPGKTYSTEDNKPTTITTEDGKTYKLVPNATTGEENGTITSGEDKQVTYVYEEVKGSVVVNYIDTEGNVIKAPVTDTPSSSTGTAYDTTDNKPTTITTEDGTTYELVPVLTKGSETGKVVEGETVVTYVYRKVVAPTPDVKTGSVVIRYVEAGNESNVLKDPVLDENAVVTGTKYDTTDEGDKPAEIVKDGVRYVLVPSKTTAVDPNGNPVTETGEVAEGTTVVTYKYQKVANWIPQIPGVPEGQEPKVPYPFDPTNPDKPIDPTRPYPGGEVPSIPHVPGFTPVDPKTNEPLKPVDPTDPGKGYVPPTPDETGVDTPIPYVQNGNVVVNYVDENGNVIKAPVQDETDAPAGKSYDTTDNKPAEIVTEDGSRYVLIPSKTVGSETGTVEGGKTTEITYVYKKVANWIPQIPGVPEGQEPKVPYPFDPTNPDKPIDPTRPYPGGEVPSIPHVPGYTPVDPKTNEPLKPVDPTDPSKGYVPPTPDESGIDTPIPYVQNGNVVVNYVTEDGTVIKAPVKDETDAPAGKSYDTTDNKPAEIVTEDGSRYVLIPSKTVGSETGTVEGGKTTEITYVYKKVANWIPQIPGVPAGEEPKVPYPFDPTNPDKPIDPTSPYPDGGVPSIPHVPGYVPVDPKTNEPLKPVDPTDPSKGYVPPTPDESGIDTPIPYVQNGNVVVNYVDENGNVIKAPVKDETDAPAGKSYDTTDNKPAEIVTEDGSRYVLIPSKTVGSETGTVEGGKTTEITYVYKKVANWIPQIPGVPAGEEPKVPYPFDPTTPDKPIDPTSPYPDGGVPSIPHVPGYVPVDPKTNEPLKPVDPTDPSKGYVPPTPDESGIDTPIPYVQNGNVVVNYVDENGNVIKAPVKDETDVPAGKSYDTTDNKPNTITTEDGTTYELVRVEGSETGTVVGGKTTEVTYVYRKVETPAKKVVTNHVDEDGNPIAPQEEGTTPNKSIPGYEYVRTVVDPDGNTTHIYRKVSNPVTPKPGTPTSPAPQAPATPKPQAPVAPRTAKAGAAQLPNTGEASSSATVLGAGMLIAALALAGKRRRNED